LVSKDPFINNILNKVYTDSIPNDIPVLTDDYAPVDSYMLPTQKKITGVKGRNSSDYWNKLKKLLSL
jgi:hypothetical protein